LNFKILVHIIFLKRNAFNGILLLFVVFFTLKSTAQELVKDSVWLPITPIKKDSFLTKSSSESYKVLYVKPIKVSVLPSVLPNQKTQVLQQQLSDLLTQFGLQDSYTVNEVEKTTLANSLQEASYLSYPFANVVTSNLASMLDIQSNTPKIVAFDNKIQEVSIVNTEVISTSKMLALVQKDYETSLNERQYLRKRLLDFLVANYNQKPESYNWIVQNNEIVPYLSTYQNQYMKFSGTHQILKKLLPSYKHFESYGKDIKNIKKVSNYTLGFDVNILSDLPYDAWEQEVHFIQEKLTESVLSNVQIKLPKSNYNVVTKQLFETLQFRVQNLSAIAQQYYKMVSKNKIVYATHKADKIQITRKKNSTEIRVYDIENNTETPVKTVEFSNKDTKQIWIYALNGNDYFTATGSNSNCIPIALIGGKGGDKYVLEQGKAITIYDEKAKTYLVETAQAKIKLASKNKFTKTDIQKYKHTQNAIKPLFGANPDDGIFVGLSDTYLIQNFNRNPFSQKHEISTKLNLGRLGFNAKYYGEIATLSNHFNAFVQLGYQSPNYATNFFGFGNEAPNLDTNLKLDYNRVRMETITGKLGVLKNEKKYEANAHLFFNSYEIEATKDRFITSETLFFPEDDFFTRKNYMGFSLAYQQKEVAIPFLSALKIQPSILVRATSNISEIASSFIKVSPNLYLEHPLYGDDITVDATLNYTAIIGNNIPFYLATNIGGNTGLRGYRNQRFTGQSSFYTSSNIKWKAKDLKSDVLPLQIGVLAGFDAGRVWLNQEESNKIHTAVGGGVWLQSANLMKAQLQVFGFDEGTRISFKLSMGL